MLSRFARLLMVLTSLAPMAFVYGVTLMPTVAGGAWLLGSLGVAGLCFGLLRYVRTTAEREVLHVERTEMQDKEVLTFIISYLLPLLRPSNINWPGFIAFACLVVVVLYQAEVLNVNPILGLAGYHFHKTTTKSGATYLIIASRGASTLKGEIVAARITDHVWLALGEK